MALWSGVVESPPPGRNLVSVEKEVGSVAYMKQAIAVSLKGIGRGFFRPSHTSLCDSSSDSV